MRLVLLLAATFALSSGMALSAPAKAKKALPQLLAEVEAHYAKSGSLSAEFSEEKFSSAFGETKSSQGTLDWKAPNSFRWETKSPESSLIISNGKTVWMYTPPFDESENGQVIISKAAQVKSRLLDALLAGRFSSAVNQGLAAAPAGRRKFALKPAKCSGGGLKLVTVTIADHAPMISKVSIEYCDGNKSTIELSSLKMGEALAKSLFEFKVPPRTDVVKE